MPLNKHIQWINDFGFGWFLKFYLRSQNQVVKLFKRSPIDVISFLALENTIGVDIPTMFDSSVFGGGLPMIDTPILALEEVINVPSLDILAGENNWLFGLK